MEALVRDTNFTESEARSEVLQLWKDNVTGLVGTSSSDGTVAVAGITKKPVQVAHVGFTAISDELSDQDKYPTFLRVNPTASEVTQAIAGLIKRTYSPAFLFVCHHDHFRAGTSVCEICSVQQRNVWVLLVSLAVDSTIKMHICACRF